jgi:aryl-alcohol dehydrogenase-like predicted oxidoreductase
MKNTSFNKISLGTVQFGIDYGITNTDGIVSQDEVYQILDYALKSGITSLDTARGYGNAEEILGGYSRISEFSISSKLSPSLEITEDYNIIDTIKSSLIKLNTVKLDKILLHRYDDIVGTEWADTEKELVKAKKLGLVSGIGVSLYNPNELEYILENKIQVDSVQVPFNIFDQRFLKNNLFERAKDQNIEIQTRSIFLQGLLLTDTKEMKPYFNRFKTFLEAYNDTLEKHSISKFQAAMSIALDNELISKVLVGVCSLDQLKEISVNINNSCKTQFNFSEWSSTEIDLIDPTEWVKNGARNG